MVGIVRVKRVALLLAGGSMMASAAAFAQAAPAVEQQAAPPAAAPSIAQDATGQAGTEQTGKDIVVVGSQIRGSKITDVLPVTVISSDDIDATAATDGDDLFRSIPQAGDVSFNESHDVGGINDARGDAASINLRALGTGNTLVLLNGRRMVLHPGTQTENLVPVQSVNTNTIPVSGVSRVEVLRDGAAAIYGTDAVAGVVNTVLKDHFDGFTAEFEGGHADDSAQEEYEGSFEAGKTFNEGRTNISVFGEFDARDPLYASERRNSRSSDLRPLVAGTPFDGDADFDNRSTDTIWGEFQRLTGSYVASTTSAKVNGVALTTNGIFHVQPNTNEGCITPAGDGVCYDNSSLSTLSIDNDLKYDTNTERTIQGKNRRINLFGYVNHEFNDHLSFFGELGYYHSDYHSLREQDTSLANQRLIIPANGYWNPFGPTTSANRLPGLTGVQDSGVPIELIDYRPVDAGPTKIHVTNTTTRFLGGLRGQLGGWDWESAALYSEARTNDTMTTVSATLFEEALSRTDSSAYNPFNGGDPLDPSRYDSTPNPQSTIDSFLVDVSRISKTSLSMWDAKFSRPDLVHLPGGDVGVAAGFEVRHESFSDDRDPRLDGTIAYVAPDGSSNGSDALGASPTPDTHGARDVESAYLELAVPVISPDMHVPLIHSIDLQLAGRFEHYTSFGSVAKPKIAASYHPIPWLQIRSSWSLGFRAPNLPQLFEQGVQRSNTRTDWVRCEADLRAGRITNFDDCAEGQSVVSNRSGSQLLHPEKAQNFSVGMTIQPPIPPRFGRLTFTADYWSIKQKDVIGLFGDANALTLDYLLRLQGGSNPAVQRAAPTAQDIADFAGTGIDPVGDVIQVIDNYTNLSPRTVKGLDLGLFYNIKNTGIGDFDIKLNAARLLKFYQQPGDLQAQLLDAQAAGTIDATIPITGAESLVRQDGRPKWRATAVVTWRLGKIGLGYYGSYVGGVEDTGAALADGSLYQVDDYLTHNIYAQYSFRSSGVLDNTRFRIGVRNIANTLPPLADTSFGYIGDLYGIRGRYFYGSIRKKF